MSLDDVFGPFPGRPQHPDFAKLVDVVLQQDGKTEDPNLDFGAYLATFIDPKSITYMAQQRAMRAMAANKMNPSLNARVLTMVAGTWLDAFMAGYLYHAKQTEDDK